MCQGIIQNKMHTEYDNPVRYNLHIGDQRFFLNKVLNNHISLNWIGKVQCICGKEFSKFYRQNFCYQCYWNAPQASHSIFKPELCTADLGIEERDLEWEKKFQITPHYVYLANSSGIKVGVTRMGNELTRWMDQGASQAILLAETPNRRLAGLIEIELKKYVSDKTNWRKMLSGHPPELDLVDQKKNYIKYIPADFKKFIVSDDNVTEIIYPVLTYPKKVKSLSFQKHITIEGKLAGIKGQYLLFDNDQVFNVRAHQGYSVDVLI